MSMFVDTVNTLGLVASIVALIGACLGAKRITLFWIAAIAIASVTILPLALGIIAGVAR